MGESEWVCVGVGGVLGVVRALRVRFGCVGGEWIGGWFKGLLLLLLLLKDCEVAGVRAMGPS